MLNVKIICVGKLKERFYIEAAEEYVKRLGGYCRISLLELSEERLAGHSAPAQRQAALEKEGAAILANIPKGAIVTALCVEGKPLSSEGLAETLSDWAGQGKSHLVFLVGSSYGLHSRVKEAAELCLSMSPMTFPHHLARVMLLEQIYRAFKIKEGSRYHK